MMCGKSNINVLFTVSLESLRLPLLTLHVPEPPKDTSTHIHGQHKNFMRGVHAFPSSPPRARITNKVHADSSRAS